MKKPVTNEPSMGGKSSKQRAINIVKEEAIEKRLPRSFERARYQEIEKLGQGAYGKVLSFHDPNTKQTVVVKIISKHQTGVAESDIRHEAQKEASILGHLRDRCESYILCYVDFAEDDSAFYIITEFLGHYVPLDRLLKEAGKELSNAQVLTLLHNLSAGLQEIHQFGVAHRDLKPDNVLVNPKTMAVKYIDFGLACFRNECERERWSEGSPGYMAPELHKVGSPGTELEFAL